MNVLAAVTETKDAWWYWSTRPGVARFTFGLALISDDWATLCCLYLMSYVQKTWQLYLTCLTCKQCQFCISQKWTPLIIAYTWSQLSVVILARIFSHLQESRYNFLHLLSRHSVIFIYHFLDIRRFSVKFIFMKLRFSRISIRVPGDIRALLTLAYNHFWQKFLA